MTTDAAPSTLVPATVVRKAKPLAWFVTSAANRRAVADGPQHEQHGEHDVGDGGDDVEGLGEPIDALL